ncbi:hypothetical protein Agabi119p4_8382 [Agaricus bisporus var. burnettii]|uniref:NACHT domain-containing protein n=2 Tax=Agaricus bisporus var. burnettii TaxID=192524 RepID=A0A8H7EYF8_AGABI|nr:hypothetical protein Agabi119p4_8382 [Agaricus bisporus var. burnettii]
MPAPSSHLRHSHASRSRSQSPKPSPISLPPRHDPYPRLGHGAAEAEKGKNSRPSSRRNPVDRQNTSQRAPTHLAFPSPTDTVHPLLPQPAPYYPLAYPSQQSLNAEFPSPPSGQFSSQLQQKSQGLFYKAHDFSASGTFVDASITCNNPSSNQFMEKLLEKTIPGAEFDSSARDPPPRCHPGTRLAILDRCLYFINHCDGTRKTRWVVGAAGVGKSALLQSIIESPKLVVSCHASVFFSINGRDDGTKAIVTISYQLAVKSEPYRQLIEREITRDPSLLQSSMAKQFSKLIVEPFIHNPQPNSANRILIVVDGLDECKDSRVQLELLRLISDLCIKYPSSPFVWLIASRPEQHITSLFSRAEVTPGYEKEEMPVNSNEARADVERFLRSEFTEIKKASDSVDPRWPDERDFWKLANAAGGLFAYAQTVINYISDTTVGSPASQLSHVLYAIDNHPMTDVSQEDHPMALLDALYARILSNVPSKVMTNTRKFLLALVFDWCEGGGPEGFLTLCNWLGMTPDEAYAALKHLRSVLCVPMRDDAHMYLGPFHKSFMDYISDFRRSGFSHDIEREARHLMAQCAFRILSEAPDGIDFGDADYSLRCGILRRGPGTGAQISVAWPVDEEDVDGTDNATRLHMYKLAIGEVVAGMERGDLDFQNEFCFRVLSTRFKEYGHGFPFHLLRDFAFDDS